MIKAIAETSRKIQITFQDEALGVSPPDPNIYENFIASKAPDAMSVSDEIEAYGAEEVVERGTSIFPRDEYGRPGIWDYQVKGFFKDACGMLTRVKTPASKSSKLKAYKKIIDGLIFVEPRFIPILLPKDRQEGLCERPLRAQTAKGERIALVRSETVPAGSFIYIKIVVMGEGKEIWPAVDEWLMYGRRRGLLGWRNSGKGVFDWQELNWREEAA